MGFDTPEGTRGAQLFSADQTREFNDRAIAMVRAGGAGMPGMNTLILITVGRKSGADRETPVAYFREPEGTMLIAASAAGAARHPDWYRNLGAHPGRARVVIAGAEHAVSAEELTGHQRARAWDLITAAAPNFAQYEDLTDRLIPVIRLTPTK
ncbi:nitroreductase/quinone reductase family protein [Paractinoplanes atraurantiacus]|uniref:Deazaflavin-dependent oxidoreductase, nitroreductase family n=1 Tax=Paractinoplanes atraurantiacus TaxID=1036182 RepID=A0A285IAH3_9ACTN|nr:nitroreductase/quinone reductase family protein [Actinoplanes atraurantiacus]SNY44787.1 deazaflavin-dependent oxidoreductase, nitroreductase family [Actinoplanes atraurantiacus]